MNTPAKRGRIKRHTGLFAYAHKEIPFAYWSHLADGQAPDTIIYLGTAQVGRIAKWAAQASPTGVVVVEGPPHWHAHPSANDIYDFMYAFTLAAFQSVLRDFPGNAVHIIAHSQAAPGAVRLGNESHNHIQNIVLMAPLGFAASIFGDTPEARYRTLLRRSMRSLFQLSQSPFYDPRNLYAGLMITKAILRETERGATKRKYAAGLSYDMLEDFRTLVARQATRGGRVTLLFGGKDKLFIAHEVQPQLEKAGITGAAIHILPSMSHLSLGARKGQAVLRAAVDIARNNPQAKEL